jgi:flagellin
MAEQSKILDTVKAKLIQANTDTTSKLVELLLQKMLQNFYNS